MKNLIKKYNKQKGPYYTSYPSLSEWSEKFSKKDYILALERFFSQEKDNSFALYTHFPFCHDKCYFCLCQSEVTHNPDRINEFLDFSSKEIFSFRNFFDQHEFAPKIKEIHLGGGSPTIISERKLDPYVRNLQTIAKVSDLEEFSIEIDPRSVNEHKLKHYLGMGIDRFSFGVQRDGANNT